MVRLHLAQGGLKLGALTLEPKGEQGTETLIDNAEIKGSTLARAKDGSPHRLLYALPELKQRNVVAITRRAFDYLESRSSKQVSFAFSTEQNSLEIPLNEELFEWVIENLIKNAIDAMQGKGSIELAVHSNKKQVTIRITDTGKGIPKSNFKQIFKPGYTTKQRGWGLGLSLSKRIVEDYHKGKLFVAWSEIGKGSTFEIQLAKS